MIPSQVQLLHWFAVFILPLMLLADSSPWSIAYEDHFESDALADHWQVIEGDWHLADGALITETGGTIALARPLEGCQRLEMWASSSRPGDLSPYLHGSTETPFSGYFLQFGGVNNTLNKGRRLKEFISRDSEHLIVPGKQHHIVAEFDGTYVSLTVDDQLVYRYLEVLEPLLGAGHQHAGIYIYTQGRIERVKLSTRPYQPPAAELIAAATRPRGPRPDGNLLHAGDGENPEMLVRWSGTPYRRTDIAHSGDACLELRREGMVTTPGFVELDLTKTYEVSGWFRSANPEQLSRVLLDIRLYTEDRVPIGPLAVEPVSGVSNVVETAPAGDAVVRVRKAGWRINDGRGRALALHAKEDLSDLPNFSTLEITGLETQGDLHVVHLSKPLGEPIPADTPVRLHRYRDHPRTYHSPVPTEWTRYAFTIAAEPAPDAPPQDYFWPGTHYAKLAVFNQYRLYPERLGPDDEQPHLLFDDLMIREIPPKE